MSMEINSVENTLVYRYQW